MSNTWYESDRKAWIRYPPPRWAWKGTAICGIPGEVSRAMLRGWHANNGVALGDIRLGFVCTKQSVDGQDGLEGYYYQYDAPLELDARLVFARHLEAPLFDAATAPALPVASWPRPRLEKAYRNYAMEYVKTAAPVMVQLFGPEEGGHLLHLTGKLIGMQYFDEVAQALSQTRGGAKEFANVPACAVRDAGRRRRDDDIRGPVRDHASELEADGRCGGLSPGLCDACWRACSRASPSVAAVIFRCGCALQRTENRRLSGQSDNRTATGLFSLPLRACAPSPRSYGERVGVRGSCHERSLRRVPLTRIASGDAIRPLPARGER